MKYAIVAVGYNRKKALERLIKSICKSDFYGNDVDLIISLDYCDKQTEIIKMLESVEWIHGEKVIRAFPERQGLRNHIIQCGDLTEKYDAVVVLEDDLVVSSGFFKYVVDAVKYYADDSDIAGISLYNHRTNPGNGRPFESSNNGYDNYFMKYAQSWGQCWTQRMWNEFKTWYQNNTDYDFESYEIPEYVKGWSKQSWLKYYIAFCATNNKYYVYPQVSLTTNNTEVGEHNKLCDPSYQVPIIEEELKREYCFCRLNDGIRYDAFFERIFNSNELLPEFIGEKCIDLYGMRKDYLGARYLVTTKALPYKIVKSISLNYRPHELNLLVAEEGNAIRVYDLSSVDNHIKIDPYYISKYDIKAISSRETLIHGMKGIINKFLKK